MKKQYQELTLTEIERAMADFYCRIPTEHEGDVDLKAILRTPEQVQAVIDKPDSPYHKIIPGYFYQIDGEGTIHTGCGGAQLMYKMFLKEGMNEDMIEQLIYVNLDNDTVPLSALKLK